jgi:hypothetical protein
MSNKQTDSGFIALFIVICVIIITAFYIQLSTN